jgi:hypothetical protein
MKTRLKAGGNHIGRGGRLPSRPAANASVGVTLLLLPEGLSVESVGRASNPGQYWPTDNALMSSSIAQRAKVYTAKSLSEVATHLNCAERPCNIGATTTTKVDDA